MSVCTQTNNRDMGGRGYFPPGLHTGRRTCLSPRGGPARRHLFTLSAWGDVRCLPVKRSGASGRGEGTARVGGAIGRRERATREGGACGWRKRAAREGGASGRRGSGVAMFVLTPRVSSSKRRSASITACLTQAGGARGRREWAARAGGAGGRRKRAARAGGARGWHEVMVCRLRADGAACTGRSRLAAVGSLRICDGPPVDPEGCPGNSRCGPEGSSGFCRRIRRGEVPLLVSPRSWAVFPAGRVKTRVRRDRSRRATKARGRRRRGPRKRRARVR